MSCAPNCRLLTVEEIRTYHVFDYHLDYKEICQLFEMEYDRITRCLNETAMAELCAKPDADRTGDEKRLIAYLRAWVAYTIAAQIVVTKTMRLTASGMTIVKTEDKENFELKNLLFIKNEYEKQAKAAESDAMWWITKCLPALLPQAETCCEPPTYQSKRMEYYENLIKKGCNPCGYENEKDCGCTGG